MSKESLACCAKRIWEFAHHVRDKNTSISQFYNTYISQGGRVFEIPLDSDIVHEWLFYVG